MLLSSPVNSKLAYAHAVETGKPGKTISSQEWGKAGRGRICSPRPDAHAVGPSKNRGTSDPRWAPNSWRAWDVRPVPKRRLSPHSVAAASLDPPPSPAPRGMRFVISMRTPGWVSVALKNRAAARCARFSSPPRPASPPPPPPHPPPPALRKGVGRGRAPRGGDPPRAHPPPLGGGPARGDGKN